MKDKKFLVLSATFFILFFAAMAAVTLDQPISGLVRARNSVPHPLKSFASIPHQIGKTGQDKLKVTVFIRDATSNVLPGRSIRLSSNLAGTTITPADTQTTDNLGTATFYIAAGSPGVAKLLATDTETNISIDASNIPSLEFK